MVHLATFKPIMAKVILKPTLKLFLLICLFSLLMLSFYQIIQVLLVPDEFWVASQILCSMDLGDTFPQPTTSDHPVIQSPAKTDLTKSDAKP
uniref:Female-specific orf protein n=1 Tax=Strophitus undulatus TaxID=85054 RepID=F4ZFL9_9BIVA|nr:female-specific orf protein [Strophitus undulatus]AEC14106.1 female-specific orf protein [Strophitus undulatus]AEC14107.1 female-specific orf protein [Strophitus undulatus]